MWKPGLSVFEVKLPPAHLSTTHHGGFTLGTMISITISKIEYKVNQRRIILFEVIELYHEAFLSKVHCVSLEMLLSNFLYLLASLNSEYSVFDFRLREGVLCGFRSDRPLEIFKINFWFDKTQMVPNIGLNIC